jgi:hypothetical protein
MEFKSTLERECDKLVAIGKEMRDNNVEVTPLVLAVHKLIEESPQFLYTFKQAIDTVKTIQPSITEEDCRIAVCLELTLCSTLIYNLIEDRILEIKEGQK